MGCSGNGDLIHHHNSLRDVLFTASRSAALAPQKEAPALIPDTVGCPVDVFLPTWTGGRPVALDVTVISPLQQLTLAEADNNPGHILQVGISRKGASKSSVCRTAGMTFIPLVVESLEGWSTEAISTIPFYRLPPRSEVGCPPQIVSDTFFNASLLLPGVGMPAYGLDVSLPPHLL